MSRVSDCGRIANYHYGSIADNSTNLIAYTSDCKTAYKNPCPSVHNQSSIDAACNSHDDLTGAMSGSRREPAPYQRIKRFLKEGLARGEWRPGDQMPSEAELVMRFGISRMTANRALRELQAEGLVERVQGLGTFAAQLQRVSSTLTIRNLQEELESGGHRHLAVVHLKREEPVPPGIAPQLGIATGAPAFHSLIVHHKNGTPVQCEDRWVNPAMAPEYLTIDFTRTTPTHYLLQVAPLWEADFTIEAATPTAEEAQLLGVPDTDPCLVLTRRTVFGNTPVTMVRLVHPGTRYQFEGRFRP